jgi:hypothetical protein
VLFAIEHRDSAQVLWRLNSGATMADAPINRGLLEEISRLKETLPRARLDAETGVLLVMGTIVVAMRHALEERVVTPPAQIAASMAAGLLRALGIAPRRAESLAARAAKDIFARS